MINSLWISFPHDVFIFWGNESLFISCKYFEEVCVTRLKEIIRYILHATCYFKIDFIRLKAVFKFHFWSDRFIVCLINLIYRNLLIFFQNWKLYFICFMLDIFFKLSPVILKIKLKPNPFKQISKNSS